MTKNTLPAFWGNLTASEYNKKSVSLYERVFTSSSGTCIFKNRNVLPRIYLVSKIRAVEDFDEAYEIMWNKKDQFDPSQEALVELQGSVLPATLTRGDATLIEPKLCT